ncbi:hypothetical protein ACWEQJ_16670 [Streptomyces cyaneofuscatus]
MRERSKKAYAVAAAAAVALTAGTTGPVAAKTTGAGPQPLAVTQDVGASGTTVTLIAGDRVLVDSRGRAGGRVRPQHSAFVRRN